MSPAMASAMLSGLDAQHIVTGQYTDNKGGACPLLAANRAGGPLHIETNFPRTWDLFCGLRSRRQARKATRHELKMLRLLLEERLMPSSERSVANKPYETTPKKPTKAKKPHFSPPRSRRVGDSLDLDRELQELQEQSKSLV